MSDQNLKNYKSSGLLTESELYYETGFKFTRDQTMLKQTTTNTYIWGITSLVVILQIWFGINHIYSILLIGFYLLSPTIFQKPFSNSTKVNVTVIIFLVAAFEQYSSGIVPSISGGLFSSIWLFIFDLALILMFGLQFLSILNKSSIKTNRGIVIEPITKEAVETYTNLTDRLEDTRYSTTNDIEESQSPNYIILGNQFQLIALLFFGIIALNWFLWQFLAFIFDPVSLFENYQFYGLTFVALVILLIFLPILFQKEVSE